MKSYKHLFSRALAAAPERLHFAAHSHHLWPDASLEGHMRAWDDAAALADRKWEKVFGEVIPTAQSHVAEELKLPDPHTTAFAPNTHELLIRLFSARDGGCPIDVLTTDGEFHSFRRQAARWEEDGVLRQRIVACEPFETFETRLLAALREQAPDIVFLSHVMFRSGLRFDGVENLIDAAPERTWIALDLYHSFMAMPSDFARVARRVFLLGGGYKYAMAGEGAGFIHAPPGYAPRPQNTGWFADFGAIEAKQGEVAYGTDGSRFLGATFDPTGLYRFNSVRTMLERESLDTRAIADRVASLRADLLACIGKGDAGKLAEAGVLAPNAHGPQARFIALRHPDATRWKAALLEANVITDARDDVLRIGLGLYHDPEDIYALCAAARRTLA